MTPCATGHTWSEWRPIPEGLLERRCGCGAVERGTYDAVNGGELARLGAVVAAFRRAFPGYEPLR
jgi:hypothetical protein